MKVFFLIAYRNILQRRVRSLMLAVALASTATGQDSFRDADFEFSMAIPSGMVVATPEELSLASGRPAQEFGNTPRAETGNGQAVHTWVLRDTTGREREVNIHIADGALPFGSPEQFESAVGGKMGVTIDVREPLRPPEYPAGMRLEGERSRADGELLRQTDAYLPMGNSPPRYAIVRAHCLAGDWPLLWPEFDTMLRSIEYPQAKEGARGTGGGQGKPGKRRAGAPGQEFVPDESWESLQVTGSLALAGMLIMGLFVGGRSP